MSRRLHTCSIGSAGLAQFFGAPRDSSTGTLAHVAVAERRSLALSCRTHCIRVDMQQVAAAQEAVPVREVRHWQELRCCRCFERRSARLSCMRPGATGPHAAHISDLQHKV